MKIYRRTAFLKLPEGTIFAKGKPWYWNGLHRKGETLIHDGRAIDFCYLDLVNIDSHDTGEWADRQNEMLETGASYPLNESEGRDGCFDDEDLFLVYEPADIETLVSLILPTPPKEQ